MKASLYSSVALAALCVGFGVSGTAAGGAAPAQPGLKEKPAKDCLLILPERRDNTPGAIVTDYYVHNQSDKTIVATVKQTYRSGSSVVREYTILAGAKQIVASSGGIGNDDSSAQVTGARYK